MPRVPPHPYLPRKPLLVIGQPRHLVIIDPEPREPIRQYLRLNLLRPILTRCLRRVVEIRAGLVRGEARRPYPARRCAATLSSPFFLPVGVGCGAHENTSSQSSGVVRMGCKQPGFDVHDHLDAELPLHDAPELRRGRIPRAVPYEVVAVARFLVYPIIISLGGRTRAKEGGTLTPARRKVQSVDGESVRAAVLEELDHSGLRVALRGKR